MKQIKSFNGLRHRSWDNSVYFRQVWVYKIPIFYWQNQDKERWLHSTINDFFKQIEIYLKNVLLTFFKLTPMPFVFIFSNLVFQCFFQVLLRFKSLLRDMTILEIGQKLCLASSASRNYRRIFAHISISDTILGRATKTLVLNIEGHSTIKSLLCVVIHVTIDISKDSTTCYMHQSHFPKTMLSTTLTPQVNFTSVNSP